MTTPLTRPIDAEPPPPLRPGGSLRRWLDAGLRIALGGALIWAGMEIMGGAHHEVLQHTDPRLPLTVLGAMWLCTLLHLAPWAPRAPRISSLASLAIALALCALVATMPLWAGIALLSLARFALYLGSAGTWLLDVRRDERRHRLALFNTGLALGHPSLSTLAGDLYEDAGFARSALQARGAHTRQQLVWRHLGRWISLSLGALPALGHWALERVEAHARASSAKLASLRAATGLQGAATDADARVGPGGDT